MKRTPKRMVAIVLAITMFSGTIAGVFPAGTTIVHATELSSSGAFEAMYKSDVLIEEEMKQWVQLSEQAMEPFFVQNELDSSLQSI